MKLTTYLLVNKPPWEVVLAEDVLNTLQMAILCGQVETGHAVIPPQGQVSTGLQQVADYRRLALDAGQHQGRILLIVECVQLGASLDQDVGGEDVTLGGRHVERTAALGLAELLLG